MTSPSIQKSKISGVNALVLENEKIRTVIATGMGARIVSLIHKPAETEYAWHNPNVQLNNNGRELENISGIFDCVPTTDPCTFKGNDLPLGGEVAGKPWKVLKAGRTRGIVTVKMEAKCRIFPLLIRKEISLAKNKPVLALRYELLNLSNNLLEYHYSSHNTLQVSPYDRIVMPHEVTKLKLGYAGRLGKIGDHVSWPEAVDVNGNRVDLTKVGGPSEGTMENLYTSKLKEKWCAVVNEAKKEAIGFTWQGEALPYLLVCTNNGGWRDYYFAAIEPVSGRPDNLDVAGTSW